MNKYDIVLKKKPKYDIVLKKAAPKKRVNPFRMALDKLKNSEDEA